MLYELLENGYAKGKDLNCAEQIVYGANEAYEMGLTKETLKMAAAFGGGMGIEDKCGAITGALMILGQLFVDERAHESDRIKELSTEFFATYEKEMKAIDCKPLKEMYRTDEAGCQTVILSAAKLLDTIVKRERKA